MHKKYDSLADIPREELEVGYDSAMLLGDNMATRLDVLTTLAVLSMDAGIGTVPADLILAICQEGGLELDEELARRWAHLDSPAG